MGKNLVARRALAGLAAAILIASPSLAPPEAQAQQRRQLSINPAATPRDYFVGRWVRYGDQFFPDEIVFEPDPSDPARLLVSFTMNCQQPAASCTAAKVQSDAAFISGGAGALAMVYVPWFKDAAGNSYTVSFQAMPANGRLVKSASKEVNALFSVVLTSNRATYFVGTEPNALRYYLPPPGAVPPSIAPRVQPRINVTPR